MNTGELLSQKLDQSIDGGVQHPDPDRLLLRSQLPHLGDPGERGLSVFHHQRSSNARRVE
ncbi:hypothetical protein CR492_16805 [Methylocella silvestris]|uniref:Uncharacterized protein n=1 Tax=Methylocella silvestris TaxID=199596 RepID=A0A2J7TDA1_METSI|nr:hypothetical protein CR492_16805 [Methylocella silvestris]